MIGVDRENAASAAEPKLVETICEEEEGGGGFKGRFNSSAFSSFSSSSSSLGASSKFNSFGTCRKGCQQNIRNVATTRSRALAECV